MSYDLRSDHDPIQQMSSIDWKKNIDDFNKDGLIKTAATIGIFFTLKATNAKPPQASLDVMDIMKLVAIMCGGLLLKEYAVGKKWILEWMQEKILWPF